MLDGETAGDAEGAGDVAVCAVEFEAAIGVGVDVCYLAGLADRHVEVYGLGEVCVSLDGVEGSFAYVCDVVPKAAFGLGGVWILGVGEGVAEVEVEGVGDVGPGGCLGG